MWVHTAAAVVLRLLSSLRFLIIANKAEHRANEDNEDGHSKEEAEEDGDDKDGKDKDRADKAKDRDDTGQHRQGRGGKTCNANKIRHSAFKKVNQHTSIVLLAITVVVVDCCMCFEAARDST